jgi:D-xylose transport system substrate-binding protein
MNSSKQRFTASVLAGIAAFGTLGACGNSSSGDTASGGGAKVAFLAPDVVLTRWEQQDRPAFTKAVKAACEKCDVLAYNAKSDPANQQRQAEAAITDGAKVLVITPVDTDAAAAIVARARQSGVKVISYGRIIKSKDVDYGVTLDPAAVGRQQAENLLETLKAKGVTSGRLVALNGSPTDALASVYKRGAHEVLDESGFTIAKEYDTPDWNPAKAQNEMEQAITAVGKDGFVGVYSANDGLASGAIAAMRGAGVDPSTRPVTGQDAELAAIQRIVAGEQSSTIYQPIQTFAAKAGELAVALAQGKSAPKGLINGTTPNGVKDVPAYLYKTTVVTRQNVKSTVVADGFWKTAQICTAKYAKACAAIGLK